MGIKYFFKWFRDSFPKTVSKPFSEQNHKLQNVINKAESNPYLLLLDLNGIIHTSCQKVYRYGSFEPKSLLKKSPPINSGEKDLMVFEDVLISINSLITLVDPKEVVLCIDGVAPISKQIQQRQRRFLCKKTNGGFDSNCISPGTDFLYRLGSYLRTHIEKKLENDWLNVTTIFFMDSLVPGEGEHKLFDFLRSNQTKIVEKKFNIIVVGNDADLIMLSLLVSTLFFKENLIYILREDLACKKMDYLMVDVNQFQKNFLNFAKDKPNFKHCNLENVVCDFVILCFMVGNDFLPQIPLFNIYDGGLDLLMKYYFTTPGYITFRGSSDPFIKINFKNLKGYFDHILNVICPNAVQYYRLGASKLGVREYGFPNTLLDCAFKKKDSFKDVSNHYLKSYTLRHKINKNLVRLYLEEIEWVFNYYAYGAHTVDWKMYYPSQYAPAPQNLVNYLTKSKGKANHKSKTSKTKTFKIDPFFQLLCILPPHSADLLPEPLNKILVKNLSHFHPENIEIDYEGKLNEWEGIPILPPLNYNEILKIYNDNVKHCSNESLKRNKRSNQLMFSVE